MKMTKSNTKSPNKTKKKSTKKSSNKEIIKICPATKEDAKQLIIARGYATQMELDVLIDKTPEYDKYLLNHFKDGGENIWILWLDKSHFMLANHALHFLPHDSWGMVVYLDGNGWLDFEKSYKEIGRLQGEYKKYWDSIKK